MSRHMQFPLPRWSNSGKICVAVYHVEWIKNKEIGRFARLGEMRNRPGSNGCSLRHRSQTAGAGSAAQELAKADETGIEVARSRHLATGNQHALLLGARHCVESGKGAPARPGVGRAGTVSRTARAAYSAARRAASAGTACSAGDGVPGGFDREDGSRPSRGLRPQQYPRLRTAPHSMRINSGISGSLRTRTVVAA